MYINVFQELKGQFMWIGKSVKLNLSNIGKNAYEFLANENSEK